MHSGIGDGRHDLTALGVGSEEHLLQLVGKSLGRQPVEVADVTVSEVAYDQLALTTLSRNRVRGTATTGGRTATFSIFVKVLQSWSRSPVFEFAGPVAGIGRLSSAIWVEDIADAVGRAWTMDHYRRAAFLLVASQPGRLWPRPFVRWIR